jgi:hypothetical protein
MFELRVVLDQPKNWLDYLPPWVTAVAALLTVVVAVLIAYKQGELQKALAKSQGEIQKKDLEQQERQLKKDLYDRRFKVFTDVGEFMRSVLSSPSAFTPGSDEQRRYYESMQNAEMLFGPDVFRHLQDVAYTTVGIWGACQRMNNNPGDNSAIEEKGERFQHLSDLWQKRSEVFRSDLSLSSYGARNVPELP